MTDDVAWLTDEEEALWRQWLHVSVSLSLALARELGDDGLSMADYHVLVLLSDTEEGELRVTDLARLLMWERSRVSHHVTRMERRGLVSRRECGQDGRVAYVGLTPCGRTAIEHAAPGHVRAVRRLFIAPLGEDPQTLAGLLDRLEAGLGAGPAAGPGSDCPRSPFGSD